jgi:hypothetical protein
MRQPLTRTPFTPFEIRLIEYLNPVGFGFYPGSSEKRFCRDMNDLLLNKLEVGMTCKQRQFLYDIAYEYRKRLPSTLRPPEKDETEFFSYFHDDLDHLRHLEPTDAELEELAAYKRDGIGPDDNQVDTRPALDQMELL